MSHLVNDALAVLEKLTGAQQPERDRAAADALGLLALVAGRMWSRPRVVTALMGGGSSPAGWLPTRYLHRRPAGPAYP